MSNITKDNDCVWRTSDVRTLSNARTGTWSINGTLTALATGRAIAQVQGVERVSLISRFGVVPQTSTSQSLLSTQTNTSLTHAAMLKIKSYLFYTRDGELLREFRYRPTTRARRVGHVIGAGGKVEMGVDENGKMVVRRGDGRGGEVRVGGGGMWGGGRLRTGWTYVGRGEKGKVGVVERREFSVARNGDGEWSWVRVGKCPSWYGGGNCMMTLRGRKLGWSEKIGAGVERWIKEVESGKKNMSRRPEGDGKKAFGWFSK